MKYALNLSKDGRILSVTYEQYAPEGAVLVDELPEGNLSDYLYKDGKFVHDPLPEPKAITVAPRNITAGEFVTVNGVLYKATENIPNGERIIVGQNAIKTTVEAQLYELMGG